MKSITSTLACTVVGLLSVTSGAGFTGEIEAPAAYLAKAFVGICVQNATRPDKVAAFARTSGYESLVGDQKLLLAPEDQHADFAGWKVLEEGKPRFLFGTSKSAVAGIPMSVCSVASPDIEVDAWVSELGPMLELGQFNREQEISGQRLRVWDTAHSNSASEIFVIDAPAMNVVGGTISLMTREMR